jgi:hypothetical protein
MFSPYMQLLNGPMTTDSIGEYTWNRGQFCVEWRGFSGDTKIRFMMYITLWATGKGLCEDFVDATHEVFDKPLIHSSNCYTVITIYYPGLAQ